MSKTQHKQKVYTLPEASGDSNAILQIADRFFRMRPVNMRVVAEIRDADASMAAVSDAQRLCNIFAPQLEQRQVKRKADVWIADNREVTPDWLLEHLTYAGMLNLTTFLIYGYQHTGPAASDDDADEGEEGTPNAS